MKTDTAPLTFQIRNVEGIRDFELSLLPGVTELLGPNGAGKTSATKAVAAACGDSASRVYLHDGAPRGYVEGCGVKLTVGRNSRPTGTPSVELAEVGLLADLIRPNLKDAEARNRARLKALTGLCPIPVDEAVWLSLAADDETIAGAAQGMASDPAGLSLLDAADLVRRAANTLALEREKLAAESRGAAAAAEQKLSSFEYFTAGGQLPSRSAADLEALTDALTREAGALRAQADARRQLEQQQEAVRSGLGERPDVQAEAEHYRALSAEIGELEQRLADLRTQREGSRARGAGLKAAAEQWGRNREILSRPLDGATEAEVQAAERGLAAAREELELAREYADFLSLKAERLAGRDRADAEELTAKSYRGVAKGLPETIAGILRRRGLPGLTIEDGRLAAVDVETGEVRDFDSRLSFGQQVRAALRVALPAHRDRSLPVVLPLDPTFWLALDAEHQQELAGIAKDEGVYVITERPCEGELRASHRGAA
jgi:hypothetical protein